MFQDIIMKISVNLNKWDLQKICLQFTYPTDFCIICSHFYYGENENIPFFIPMNKIKLFCAQDVMTKVLH